MVLTCPRGPSFGPALAAWIASPAVRGASWIPGWVQEGLRGSFGSSRGPILDVPETLPGGIFGFLAPPVTLLGSFRDFEGVENGSRQDLVVFFG